MADARRSGGGSLYQPGQLIPGTKLRVEQYVGGGGMGSVYAVVETSVNKHYVVKLIHPHLLATPQASERMMQEATTLANLEHRNIVQVYWAGLTQESPPLPFYVMECLRGYPLRHALAWHVRKRLELPLSWFFHIAASLLLALEYAHEHHVIHRDVKPDNIFLHLPRAGKPLVKLLDFGILAILSEETVGASAGHFTGTLTYAAPEQLRGERPTPAIDIYAAGLVMYEMLAGRGAFDHHTTPHALIHAHLHESPTPLRTRRSVHPKLAELIHSMLEKEPSKRPRSAGDVVRALAVIQTEWVARGHETFTSDPVAFQFDADMGPLWVTNAGVAAGGSPNPVPGTPTVTAPASPSEAALLRSPKLAEIESFPLDASPELLSTGGQRSGWGQTVGQTFSKRRSRLILAAGGVFVGLSVGLLVLLRPYTALPDSSAAASVSASTVSIPPVPVATEAASHPAAPAEPVSTPAPSSSTTETRPLPTGSAALSPSASAKAQPVPGTRPSRKQSPRAAPVVSSHRNSDAEWNLEP